MDSLRVVFSKKDFIRVEWSTDEVRRAHWASVHGYLVRYNALDSSYVHVSDLLAPDVRLFDIVHLHENTMYNICVKMLYNETHSGLELGCIEGTTRTDSLGVAIGSTLGAFLALSFIVLLVFLAKRQHHLLRKNNSQGTKVDRDSSQLAKSVVNADDYNERRCAEDEDVLCLGDHVYLQLVHSDDLSAGQNEMSVMDDTNNVDKMHNNYNQDIHHEGVMGYIRVVNPSDESSRDGPLFAIVDEASNSSVYDGVQFIDDQVDSRDFSSYPYLKSEAAFVSQERYSPPQPAMSIELSKFPASYKFPETTKSPDFYKFPQLSTHQTTTDDDTSTTATDHSQSLSASDRRRPSVPLHWEEVEQWIPSSEQSRCEIVTDCDSNKLTNRELPQKDFSDASVRNGCEKDRSATDCVVVISPGSAAERRRLTLHRQSRDISHED